MSKKVKITKSQVKHVANLARLGLSAREINKFQKQLSSILDFVSQLDEVDTTNIEPTSQVTGLENIFREDKIEPSFTQQEVLANAPETHNGYFKVKAIL